MVSTTGRTRPTKRRLARAITIVAIATLGALFALTSAAGAATQYGPYSSKGTCNYWRSGVAAAGHRVSACVYKVYHPTCPGGCGRYGWFFTRY